MLWTNYDMPSGKLLHWQIGPLDLWLHHLPDEWCSSTRLDPERTSGDGMVEECREMPVDLEIARWLVKARDQARILLQPAMPDRPVAVRTLAPLTLLPGSSALFFISIPVWAEVYVGESTGERLVSIPTVNLSNSWFGLPTDGEVCYALRSRARREVDGLEQNHYRAICPMTVKNEAKEPLLIQRLFLRTAPLSIYAGDTNLWTNGCTFRYQGEGKSIPIVYQNEAPAFDHAATLLRVAREVKQTGFFTRSFGSLREAFVL